MSASGHRPPRQTRGSITLSELIKPGSDSTFDSREDHLVHTAEKCDTAGFYQRVPSAGNWMPLLNTAGHFKTIQAEANESMCVIAGLCWRYPSASFGTERRILDAQVGQALNAAASPMLCL